MNLPPASLTAFLAARGGRLVNDVIADFGDYTAECDACERAACLADASDLGLLRIHGVDATDFLHNQLSTSVKALAPGQGQYSTYNSPKGRMLASLFLWRSPAGDAPVFYALVAADLAASLKKRLAMFVLRARVVIDDVSADHAVLGLCGDAATAARNALGLEFPAPLTIAIHENLIAVTLSPAAQTSSPRRIALLLPLAALPGYWEILCKTPGLTPAGRHLWRRAAILEGVPSITAATADRLIPQAANQDALGALDFHKGCYPGQEIIARTRYLGRTKERLYLARCDASTAAPAPGAPLYSPVFGGQSCGIVVNAAPDRQGFVLLASMQTAAADSALHLGQLDGPAVTLLPLPYGLPTVETSARPRL